jgi:large subunit ribosomal protein L12
MEYIYAAMLLHKAGKEITEESVTKVLKSSGVKADSARVKALIAALSEVDIDEAIKSAPTFAPSQPATAPKAAEEAELKEKKKESKEKEGKEKEEEALEGLGALFG